MADAVFDTYKELVEFLKKWLDAPKISPTGVFEDVLHLKWHAKSEGYEVFITRIMKAVKVAESTEFFGKYMFYNVAMGVIGMNMPSRELQKKVDKLIKDTKEIKSWKAFQNFLGATKDIVNCSKDVDIQKNLGLFEKEEEEKEEIFYVKPTKKTDKRPYACYNCGRTGHFSYQCTYCNNCDMNNHHTRECTKSVFRQNRNVHNQRYNGDRNNRFGGYNRNQNNDFGQRTNYNRVPRDYDKNPTNENKYNNQNFSNEYKFNNNSHRNHDNQRSKMQVVHGKRQFNDRSINKARVHAMGDQTDSDTNEPTCDNNHFLD